MLRVAPIRSAPDRSVRMAAAPAAWAISAKRAPWVVKPGSAA